MCARCEELEGEVAYLRSELGLVADETVLTAFQRAFGITAQQARALAFLHRCKGRVVTKWQLLEGIGSEAGHEKLPDVLICKLREKMGRANDYIGTIWGRGYGLTIAGIAKCDEVIATESERAA